MSQRRARGKSIDSVDQAFARALHFLGARARSEAEVKSDLLDRGASRTVIDTVLEKLRQSNYLNDREFARNRALARVENRGHGPARIRQELRVKGVDNKIIESIIDEIFAAKGEKETAQTVLQRRFKNQDLADIRVLRRAAGYLLRQGYSSEVVAALLGGSGPEIC